MTDYTGATLKRPKGGYVVGSGGFLKPKGSRWVNYEAAVQMPVIVNSLANWDGQQGSLVGIASQAGPLIWTGGEDTLRTWAWVAFAVRTAHRLHSLLVAKDVKALRGFWSDGSFTAPWPEDMPDQLSPGIDFDDFPPDQIFALIESVDPSVWTESRQFDDVDGVWGIDRRGIGGPSMDQRTPVVRRTWKVLVDHVNGCLQGNISFQLSPTPKLRLGLMVDSLVTMIWYEVAVTISRGYPVTQACGVCGTWFAPDPSAKRRDHARYCGDACKMAAYRARKRLRVR